MGQVKRGSYEGNLINLILLTKPSKTYNTDNTVYNSMNIFDAHGLTAVSTLPLSYISTTKSDVKKLRGKI